MSAASSLANAFNIAVECAEDVFDSHDDQAQEGRRRVHSQGRAAVDAVAERRPRVRSGTPPASPKALVVAEAVSPLPRIPSGKPSTFLPTASVEAEAWPLRAFFEVGTSGGKRARLLCTGPTQPYKPRRSNITCFAWRRRHGP